MKSAVELLKKGLYSIMLVKFAYKQFPRHFLGQSTLEKGWLVVYPATIDDHSVQAGQFRDLKLKVLAALQLLGNPKR